MQYRIEVVRNLTGHDARELLELFAEAEFADFADGFEWLQDAVAGSLEAVVARNEAGKIIGFARALGDGVSDCYIQDVAVRIDCRRNGIGKALINALLKRLRARQIDWVGLIAAPGKADFYRQLGFEVMADFTPMRLKQQNEN